MCRCGCLLLVDDGGICADGRSEAEHLAARVHALTSQLAALMLERDGIAAELHDMKHDLMTAEHDCAKAKKLHAELAEFASATCDSLRDELDRI